MSTMILSDEGMRSVQAQLSEILREELVTDGGAMDRLHEWFTAVEDEANAQAGEWASVSVEVPARLTRTKAPGFISVWYADFDFDA